MESAGCILYAAVAGESPRAPCGRTLGGDALNRAGPAVTKRNLADGGHRRRWTTDMLAPHCGGQVESFAEASSDGFVRLQAATSFCPKAPT